MWGNLISQTVSENPLKNYFRMKNVAYYHYNFLSDVTVKILRHARSICIMFIFGRITHVTKFLFNKIIKNDWCVLICVPEEAQVGETLYIFDDLLKRNFVTCVIRPKITLYKFLSDGWINFPTCKSWENHPNLLLNDRWSIWRLS